MEIVEATCDRHSHPANDGIERRLMTQVEPLEVRNPVMSKQALVAAIAVAVLLVIGMDKDGAPRTFYKPDPVKQGFPTNLDYFNAQ
jgi:hypothetical protein